MRSSRKKTRTQRSTTSSASILTTVLESLTEVHIIADKPNRIFKQEEEDKKKVDPKVLEVEEKLKNKIIECHLTPKLKYKHPMTASQEIGWVNSKVSSC